MLTKIVLILALAAVITCRSEDGYCHYHNLMMHPGWMLGSAAGEECGVVQCKQDGDISLTRCDQPTLAPGCYLTVQDNNKPYPRCCPKPKCEPRKSRLIYEYDDE